ncbi:hypothetical protein TanjilG_25725 [Lupinus angustifolius]|uniref:Uncharacterized protein n=1 Tax=Lupinus angustifolius TaxID=3871 RepID=A0A1J7HI69_LUPAN|nr:hypothetical protein TanjilG_25725 [Lupinus angustifolius]
MVREHMNYEEVMVQVVRSKSIARKAENFPLSIVPYISDYFHLRVIYELVLQKYRRMSNVRI